MVREKPTWCLYDEPCFAYENASDQKVVSGIQPKRETVLLARVKKIGLDSRARHRRKEDKVTPSQVLAKLGIEDDAKAYPDNVHAILTELQSETKNMLVAGTLHVVNGEHLVHYPEVLRIISSTGNDAVYLYRGKTNLDVATAIMQWGAK